MNFAADWELVLNSLNAPQRAAVECIEGPLLILAGPGSGKTRVITHRIAHMIHCGIDSRQIVAVTFTNKAAQEMKLRLEQMVPGHQAWLGTFHRFCSRLLRMYAPQVGLAENFTIYDTSDSRKLFKQALAESQLDLRHYTLDSLANQISQLKNQGIMPEAFEPRPGNHVHRVAAHVYPLYQKLLRLANGVDFDDLLLLAGQLLVDNEELRHSLDERFAYMMVDEYQDTNVAQYRLVKLLNRLRPNLAVTGDPDQSIYGWRGATLRNILDFERDYPGVRVVRLEQNYRSTQAILHVADELIVRNQRRKAKELFTENPPGDPVSLVAYTNPEIEAHDIANSIALAIRTQGRRPSDFAILYRTNALSRALEHALNLQRIPYQIVQGLEFYQRREIKDLLAYLHLLNNPADSVALERVINTPTRGIGAKTVERIRRYALDSEITVLEGARRAGLIEGISKAAAIKVSRFVALLDKLTETQHLPVADVLQQVVDATDYRNWLIEDGSEESHERASNVDELIAAAAEFDRQHPEDGGLEAFLEQAALVNDTDAWESTSDYVTLLTIHASKGLEFPCVYIIGLEDGLVPHERASANDEGVEEERRLLFVGITRAQQRLQLSRCLNRFRRGGYWPSIASRFLMEMPRQAMRVVEPSGPDENVDHEDEWAADMDPWMHDGIPERDINDDEVQEAPTQFRLSPPPPTRRSPQAFPKLLTAAEIARSHAAEEPQNPDRRYHPERFSAGIRVRHPEYGLGVILETSGSGIKKVAIVEFSEMGKRRFRLSHSPLEPLE